ncbi:MAG TPA: endonuclease/exonuclease/phosphatase family protein [Caulobacteraceae bacterium]|nr:endonuclease/exonuclease/phosphatase family protein [Caulobacteraceae bacterium]
MKTTARKPGGPLAGLLLWSALAAAVAVALAGLLADLHYVFDLGAQFAAPAFSLSLLFAFFALLLHRNRAMAGLLLAALALFLNLRPQWFPPEPQPKVVWGVKPAKVYFANVWARNERLADLAFSIAEADADVVAMVEVSPLHAEHMKLLLDRYPYQFKTNASPNGGARTLIASRFPLKATDRGFQDGLAVLEARVMAPDRPFRLVAVHLTRPWPFYDPHVQRRQTESLIRRVHRGDPETTVVVGDFNATGSGALLRDFRERAHLRMAPAIAGTWPSVAPAALRLGIDNAFAGEDLALINRRLGLPNGSDHRPIVFQVAPAEPRRR